MPSGMHKWNFYTCKLHNSYTEGCLYDLQLSVNLCYYFISGIHAVNAVTTWGHLGIQKCCKGCHENNNSKRYVGQKTDFLWLCPTYIIEVAFHETVANFTALSLDEMRGWQSDILAMQTHCDMETCSSTATAGRERQTTTTTTTTTTTENQKYISTVYVENQKFLHQWDLMSAPSPLSRVENYKIPEGWSNGSKFLITGSVIFAISSYFRPNLAIPIFNFWAL